MKVSLSLLIALVIGQALAASIAQADTRPGQADEDRALGHLAKKGPEVVITAPTLIAFAKPSLRDARDEASSEALAHLAFAVEDTKRCALPEHAKVETIYADIFIVRNGAMTQAFSTSAKGHELGAVLVEPGRKARLVIAEVGPSALVQMLPEAAAKYWNLPSCEP